MKIAQQNMMCPISYFLQVNHLDKMSSVREIFHAVRRVPYGSGAGRTVQSVVTRNVGSCSGKHMLLRDILRFTGRKAEIETIRGDFAASIPPLVSMSDELRRLCRAGGVTDYHNYVVLDGSDKELKLDVTWSDGPIAEGLDGNQDWNGLGDTKIAVTAQCIMNREEDVPAYKEELIAKLPAGIRQKRSTFLTLLTNWVAETEKGGK